MFHNIMAIELLARDLTKCTAFYRDTLGLEMHESESTADSISFQMGTVDFFLLGASGAAQMVSSEPLFSMEGGPRVLLAAGVENVDAAYETLSAKRAKFLRSQLTSPGDYAPRTLPTRKAIPARSTDRSTGSLCRKLKAPPHRSTVAEARSRQL